jgi:hypothetical protein
MDFHLVVTLEYENNKSPLIADMNDGEMMNKD